MVAAGPGVKAGHVEEMGVSLLDLLPTFNELASGGKPMETVDRLDGRSLVNMMNGDSSGRDDEVMIEFLGEGVYAPACILRQNGFKYVYCGDDPAMMFDLNTDPNELQNLADDPVHADRTATMRRTVFDRWDYDRIDTEVRQSQRRRLFAQEALLKGKFTAWDYQPTVDATRQYVRGAVDPNTTSTKSRLRFPFVQEVKPDAPRPSDTKLDLSGLKL